MSHFERAPYSKTCDINCNILIQWRLTVKTVLIVLLNQGYQMFVIKNEGTYFTKSNNCCNTSRSFYHMLLPLKSTYISLRIKLHERTFYFLFSPGLWSRYLNFRLRLQAFKFLAPAPASGSFCICFRIQKDLVHWALSRPAQHTARGPHTAREIFSCGPRELSCRKCCKSPTSDNYLSFQNFFHTMTK